MQLGEDPHDLDDAGRPRSVAGASSRSLLQRPIFSFIRTSAIAQPRFARIVWQWLTELVERAQPRLDCLLDTVLSYLPLQSEIGESCAVGRLAQILVGLIEQGMQGRDVTDQLSGIRGVKLQLPRQREVGGPALLTEEAETVSAVLEGQRERCLRPRFPRRTAKHLDEPDALCVVGQAVAADADMTRGLEQPVVAKLDQPSTDPEMNLALVVFGQADSAPPRPPGHG